MQIVAEIGSCDIFRELVHILLNSSLTRILWVSWLYRKSNQAPSNLIKAPLTGRKKGFKGAPFRLKRKTFFAERLVKHQKHFSAHFHPPLCSCKLNCRVTLFYRPKRRRACSLNTLFLCTCHRQPGGKMCKKNFMSFIRIFLLRHSTEVTCLSSCVCQREQRAKEMTKKMKRRKVFCCPPWELKKMLT